MWYQVSSAVLTNPSVSLFLVIGHSGGCRAICAVQLLVGWNHFIDQEVLGWGELFGYWISTGWAFIFIFVHTWVACREIVLWPLSVKGLIHVCIVRFKSGLRLILEYGCSIIFLCKKMCIAKQKLYSNNIFSPEKSILCRFVNFVMLLCSLFSIMVNFIAP